MKKHIFILLFSCLYCFSIIAQEFVHPGIIHKESDFARMRQKIAQKKEPWYTTYQNLKAHSGAQLSWNCRATETILRGGTGQNPQILYMDIAAIYAHALIYKISGDKNHGNKAVEMLNAWSSIHKTIGGNADRYLASGLYGYQMANAGEMMRGYPGFEFERFKNYMWTVYYKPLTERFLLSNEYGRDHNDACISNYRANWDLCNMACMLAVGVLCDNVDVFNKGLEYFKNGGGNGSIRNAAPYLHTPFYAQWEESGRDQGHATLGIHLMGMFCEIAWNQGVDCFSYDNNRFRKAANYVAAYNLWVDDAWKYDNLPYTAHWWRTGQNCTLVHEDFLSGASRGHGCPGWVQLNSHYTFRAGNNQQDSIPQLKENSNLSPILGGPGGHATTYDHPQYSSLTFQLEDGDCTLPWENMDINTISLTALQYYGSASLSDQNLNVKGSGTGIQGFKDWFNFTFQRLINDGIIIAKVSESSISDEGTVGLMIRNGLTEDAANIFFGLAANDKLIISSRSTQGNNTDTISFINAPSGNIWLKLQRLGDAFAGFYSIDGNEWIEAGRKNLYLSAETYIGCAISSNDRNKQAEAYITDLSFENGNMKPIVRLSSPVTSTDKYIGKANIIVKGYVNDIDGDINRTELYLNDNVYTTLYGNNINYTLPLLKEGDYTTYIVAYDNEGDYTSSDTVSFTVNPPTDKLPYYNFNLEKKITAVPDSSGNKLNGVCFGSATYEEGKFGNCIVLNGTNSYIRLPNNVINKLSNFTVSTWIYLTKKETWARIFDFGSSTTSSMFLTVDAGNSKMRFSLETELGSQYLDASISCPINNWYNIVVTLEDDVLNIYLNGINRGTSQNFTLRPYDLSGSDKSYIGKSQWDSDPLLSAKIDEFRIYNYALTQDEIKTNMSAPTALEETGYIKNGFYPNPVQNNLFLMNPEPGTMIHIYDISGRNVFSKTIGDFENSIDVSDLETGNYLIIMSCDGSIKYKSSLIKK